MNVTIETYRGIEIIFNTESERFSYNFDQGGWSEKQSYAACKKNIDDYFKENQNFQPFIVRHQNSGRCIKIIGMRKDNKFIYEKGKEKEQLSEYDERDYIEYNEDHDKKYAMIALLEAQRDSIRQESDDILRSINGTSLREIKKTILNPQPCPKTQH